MARGLVSLTVGLVVGLAATERLPRGPNLGLPSASVLTVSGLLGEDPRRLESGSSLLSIELSMVSDAAGRRASATGGLKAFVDGDEALAIHAAGRGSFVVLEGTLAESRIGPVFRSNSAVILKKPGLLERRRNAALFAALSRFSKVDWGGLAAALLLGNRDGLDEGEGERYAASGCAHVLSLSGMHLAVISALVALALKRPLGLRGAAVVGTLLVVCYVLFVGFQPALTRSVIMYAIGAAALLGGFPRRILPLLAAAFVIQLILDVESARSLSFVLSYLALLGIALLGGAADDLVRGLLPGPLRMPIATSVGAFLATATVCAAAFGSLRPVGIVAGLVVAPAATVLMIAALAWFALDLIAPPLAATIEPAVGFVAKVGDWSVETAAHVRGLETPTYAGVLAASLAISALLVYGRYRLEETRNRVDPFD